MVESIVNNEATVTISGSKSWVGVASGNLPESITVALYNGEDQVGNTQTITADNSWKYFFTAPKYDANGNAITTYNVRENLYWY